MQTQLYKLILITYLIINKCKVTKKVVVKRAFGFSYALLCFSLYINIKI